jgi:L-alanine-DL-glutamate epimerase-like enolase superfamily enzyme
VELEARTVTLRLAETFVISRNSTDEAESVIAEVRHDGYSGFGEGMPIDRYEEDAASAVEFLHECGDVLGDDPFALDEIAARLPARAHTQAARAALDHALHDLCGKLTGLPVWRLLGLRRRGPPTCWTVWLGDPDEMARRAEQTARLFGRLKLKLGGRDGVEYCEQPLPAGDEGGATLKARSPIPIYVDEDCHTLADVAGCADLAHGINIKLSKSGGIREAVRMAHAARALNLGVMLGCMTESGLGISAGAQIASLCDFIDLDGNLLLAEDPWPGVELRDGAQLPPDKPGLGVEARQAVSDPR